MNRPAIITHLLAAVAGALALASWTSSSNSQSQAKEQREAAAAPTKSKQRETAEAAASFREMLETLRWTPMLVTRRRVVEEELWREWAKSDPKGLLAYLEDKAWPRGSGFGLGGGYLNYLVFGKLAIDDPSYLAAYARSHGCFEAWRYLCTSGDPATIFTLLASEKEPVPPSIYEELFKHGAELNSSFHHRIVDIADPAAKAAAFAGGAPALLELNRLDDFMSLVADTGIDGKQAGEVLGQFAAEKGRPELISEFEKLPPAARPAAVATLLDGLASIGGHYSPPSAEDLIAGLRSLNAADGWGWTANSADWQETLEGVIDMCGLPESDVGKTFWYDWALQLPGGELSTVMKRAALKRWAQDPGPDWQPRLAAIADPALHDMAAATLALGLPGEEEASAVVAMIHDEAFRKETLKELGLDKEEEDPFGSGEPSE